MRNVKFPQTRHSIDQFGTLKIFVDEETLLTISSTEVLAAAQAVLDNVQSAMGVNEDILKRVREGFSNDAMFPGTVPPGREKDILDFIGGNIPTNSKATGHFHVKEFEAVLKETVPMKDIAAILRNNGFSVELKESHMEIKRK
jgi:hypothetical protein